MKKLGIIGWRGMVGSVLIDRMQQENDFDKFNVSLFSTSQAGQAAPRQLKVAKLLLDAEDLEQLSAMDYLLSAQGSDYTELVRPQLDEMGWKGYWIDAASLLRTEADSQLILDPVNKKDIVKSLDSGIKNYIGSNCTVSPMLMAMNGLFKQDLIEWISMMTYQAASGAGAKSIKEMLLQMYNVGTLSKELIDDPSSTMQQLDQQVSERLRSDDFPQQQFGAAIAGNVLPWIDSEVDGGQSREEWKGMVETNLLLGEGSTIPVDGTCVRVGAMRSHSLALTIKLKQDVSIDQIEEFISSSTDWTKVVANNKKDTISQLTPAQVSGSLDIRVGRLRKMKMGPQYLNAFVVGDQLLWGAAEPLRRMLHILNEQSA
ncbi:aspartate-semialdehyde dehydrogenase [Candidatus Saccharibacteria bacterium]|nr:aspartate-semialdehyde dehydrogenase [Candidatus Saccharibacteria bacterium]